jgi:CPA2 family monovalent cation:H+ antiporter-2
LASQVGKLASAKPRTLTTGEEHSGTTATPARNQIVMVGFGPAGQRAADVLMPTYKARMVVVEMSAKSADVSRTYGLPTIIGDATRAEVLEHLHIEHATAVIITVPDPAAARHVIEQVRALSPHASIFARARYHLYRWELMLAGGDVVIDEEEQVGLRLAAAVRKHLREERPRA